MPISKLPSLSSANKAFMSAEGVDSSQGDFLAFTTSRSRSALKNGSMGCVSCEEGRLKTLYGISDVTDYELTGDDKYISDELGGNAVFMSGYPGITGLMGPRPPSAFQFTRLNPAKHNGAFSDKSNVVMYVAAAATVAAVYHFFIKK